MADAGMSEKQVWETCTVVIGDDWGTLGLFGNQRVYVLVFWDARATVTPLNPRDRGLLDGGNRSRACKHGSLVIATDYVYTHLIII